MNVISIALVFGSLLLHASAQWTSVEEARLTGPGIGGNQGFGTSVDVVGDTAVVGVPRPSSGFGGRVFVYTRVAGVWTFESELLASDDIQQNGFGSDVALDGNTLVIGASSATVAGEVGAGVTYVFTRVNNVWTEQQKLVPPDELQGAAFGTSVAVSGNTLAVGSPQQNSPPNYPTAGATYVYVRSNNIWTLQQRIVPLGNVYGARTGTDVALEGNSLLIGGFTWFDGVHIQAGSVWEFTRSGSTWSQAAQLLPNDPSSPKSFGASVALDGSRCVIGAWGDGAPAYFLGAAYVFRRSGAGWVQEQKLVPQNVVLSEYYGTSVDIDGTTVLIGGPTANSSAANDSGSVRLFDFDGSTWSERHELVGSQTSVFDRLGQAVALDGNTAIAGANFADDPQFGTCGEAYVWRVSPAAISTYCTAKTNSLGCVPVIAGNGTPSVSAPQPFTVSASQVLNQKQGLLFYGLGPAAAPFQGGWLCVIPPTRRLPVSNSGGTPSGSDCSGVYAYDFNAQIQSGFDPALVAGEDVYCQFWTRDPQSPSTTGLSNGLRAHIQP